MTDEQNAELLSRLSLKFSNIKGAICDDLTTSMPDPNDIEDVAVKPYAALKKHNPDLKMYGVVYVHELEKRDFTNMLPYMDVVNLWFWNMPEVLEFEKYMDLFQKKFPGKKILLGVSLQEYGITNCGNPPELLCYQLDCARKYMAHGLVEGVAILGDREIPKWPETSEGVRDYLRRQ